jgi:hypothetical protein
MRGCFDNCVGVLVICVLVFTVLRIGCIVFCIFSLRYVLFLFVLFILVQELLPPGENSIAAAVIIIIIIIIITLIAVFKFNSYMYFNILI